MATEDKIRIDTLRKAKMREGFEKSGISNSLFEDFVIRLPKHITLMRNEEVIKTAKESIQRQMRKKMDLCKSLEELMVLAKAISFGSNEIEVTSLAGEEVALQDYAVELVASIVKASQSGSSLSMFEKFEHIWPVKVQYKQTQFRSGNYQDLTAYSSGNNKIGKRHHNQKWHFKRRKKAFGSLMIVDLTSIFTDIFLNNVVEMFTIKNKDLFLYKRAEQLLIRNKQRASVFSFEEFQVPEHLESRNILIESLKKYDLVPTNAVFKPVERLNNFGEFSIIYHDTKTDRLTNMSEAIFETMLIEIIKQTDYIKDKVDRAIRETSDYARSFQTKKHINKQTEAVMKNNVFLKKYGYVELDNDVSIDKFHVLEKEFEYLASKIYIPKCDNHSFRIKKLGNHHAAGLYYPAPIRATLFDLDYPDAYCHELGHQLDHVLAADSEMLSETVRFKRVTEKYMEVVNKKIAELKEDDPFKKAWKGKTKYNSSYFFLPTEIFARSFELYIHHKGIQSSFLKVEYNSPIYPNDEEYLKLVANYFDLLFSMFEVDATKEPRKAPPTSAAAPIIIEPVEQNVENKKAVIEKTVDFYELTSKKQLSLF